MEPVRLSLTFTGERKPNRVDVLDNDGRRQSGVAPYPVDAKTGSVSLDGTRDRTLYYEIEY